MIRIGKNIRIDRNEIAGSFGDIGTDLPLIIGMIMVSGIDSASTLIVYGLLQILSGLIYGIPMAVQPLKAVATLVIAQKLGGDIIFGGGLAIGVVMLILTLSGAIKKLALLIPLVVIRGVQVGLGILLAMIAMKEYIVKDSGLFDIILTVVAFAIGLFLLGNRKYPAALFMIGLGILYSFVFTIDSPIKLFTDVRIAFPSFNLPDKQNIINGFLLLALPQIPLSIGNSILASKQLSDDLFPEKKITVNKISLTYSFMNIVSPFFGGIPVCHGSGGMSGHYTFGARTGGSVMIYGILFLIVGIFFSHNFDQVMKVFPMQILGVILLFESLTLLTMMKDVMNSKRNIYIVLLVAIVAVGLPYGFLIAMITGTILYYWSDKFVFLKDEPTHTK